MTQISEPSQPGPLSDRLPKRTINKRLLLGVVLAIAGLGFIAWYFLSRPATDRIEMSGRVEGYETDVGTKVPGRVQEVTVREGAQVKAGELLVQLDDDEIRAELEGAIASINAARQQEANARLQVSVIESQINEAQLNLAQSQEDTQGRVNQAEASLATTDAQLEQARAQVQEAEAQLELARSDRDRFVQLAREGAVTQQRADQAQTSYQTALATLNSRQAAVAAAQRQVNAAEGSLTQVRSATFNPEIRQSQLNRLSTQLQQAETQLAAAQAEVRNAQANRQQIEAQLNDLTIVSPIDGVVTVRSIEPGVVVTTGRTLLTLVDLNDVYMRAFIPEGQIGLVRIGQEAFVYLDSNPDQALTGEVIAIDAEASFTPENVYFKEDRVQQVFGVRIRIDSPNGFAKPGMPADGEILLEDSDE